MATGIRKLYYSIREVSEMTGLKPHVLRYWESEFDALRPKKNRAGNRAYTEPDIAVVRRIQSLVHDEKYTLEGARQVLDREAEPGSPLREALTDLPREQLVDLRAFLADVLRAL
jgi:DNA-binding transcriptional MerR regulator